ncbi:MAG: hypothetical protein SPE48_01670, partial [Treponema porcinum]|uniref:hypothetical protein n=1 Tax=Treponema porcinum TaxID=261392 RepID=UPI002A83813E
MRKLPKKMANFLGKFPKDKIAICCILTDMDKKESIGSGFKIKALFKIEFIFIYIAVLNFGFSIVCKTYTNKKIANLNSQMIKIQLEENSGIFNHQNLIQKL